MNEAQAVRKHGMRICNTINCDKMTPNEIYCDRCTEEITGDRWSWRDVAVVIVAMVSLAGGAVSGWLGGRR